MQILSGLFLGVVIGLGLGIFWKEKNQSGELKEGINEPEKEEEKESLKKGTALSRELEEKKKINLEKLKEYLKESSKITNDEVEKLLEVSNTTAYRYLEELEKDGVVRQVGETGRAVYYERI